MEQRTRGPVGTEDQWVQRTRGTVGSEEQWDQRTSGYRGPEKKVGTEDIKAQLGQCQKTPKIVEILWLHLKLFI